MKKCIKSRKPPHVGPVLAGQANLRLIAGPFQENPPCLDFESEAMCVSKGQGYPQGRQMPNPQAMPNLLM